MQLEVIQTPSSMVTGTVSKAMSVPKACVPVVKKLSWLTTTSASDLDPGLVVNPHALTDPGPGADRKLPRELHPKAWAQDDVLAYLGPEET